MRTHISQECEKAQHDKCEEFQELGRIMYACTCPCHRIFKSPSSFLEAVSKLSHSQKERMLMDLAWKCWVKPKGATMKQISVVSYHTAKMID